jgi:hypothetical protein
MPDAQGQGAAVQRRRNQKEVIHGFPNAALLNSPNIFYKNHLDILLKSAFPFSSKKPREFKAPSGGCGFF